MQSKGLEDPFIDILMPGNVFSSLLVYTVVGV